jgi:stage V sporulation protein AE
VIKMMFVKAFVVGGLICVVGQLLIDLTKLTPARILVLFVCLGVLLGGLGLYDKLIDFAGAGATVPLTGFGSALAKGVREAIKSDGFLGVITGGLQACSAGVTVAILSGLTVALIAKPKDK